MKRLTAMGFALLLFSGAASAQSGANGNVLQALLGANGPVQGLMATLMAPQEGGSPLVNGLVGDQGLIRGAVASPLDATLTGLLVNQDPEQSGDGLQNTVTLTLTTALGGLTGSEDPSDLPGLLTGLFSGLVPGNGFSGGGLGGGFLGGAMLAGAGQGLSPDAIPLDGVDPGTQAALANGVTLPGL